MLTLWCCSVPVKNYLSRGLAHFSIDLPGRFLVRRGQSGICLFETLSNTLTLWITEDKLSLIMEVGQHVGYCLIVMMLAAYLNLPRLSRLLILVLSILNSSVEVRYRQGVGFREMTGVFVVLVLGRLNWIIISLSALSVTRMMRIFEPIRNNYFVHLSVHTFL